MKTKKAFTLVELLVVIAILAILATATIVGFTAFTKKAKQSNLEGELKQVTELLQLEDYYNGGFEIANGKIMKDEEYEMSAEEFASLIANLEDQELKGYAGRLVYDPEHDTLILYDKVTDPELQAMWVVGSNSITSGNAE